LGGDAFGAGTFAVLEIVDEGKVRPVLHEEGALDASLVGGGLDAGGGRDAGGLGGDAYLEDALVLGVLLHLGVEVGLDAGVFGELRGDVGDVALAELQLLAYDQWVMKRAVEDALDEAGAHDGALGVLARPVRNKDVPPARMHHGVEVAVERGALGGEVVGHVGPPEGECRPFTFLISRARGLRRGVLKRLHVLAERLLELLELLLHALFLDRFRGF